MRHPVDRQVFHGNQVKAVDDAAAVLMGEVAAPPGDTLMHPRHHTAAFGAFWRPLFLFGQAALCFGERLSSPRKKRGLAISCTSREVANVFKPTSMPTCRPVSGKGDGSAHSHEKQTYHLPVLLRLMVAVLGVPSKGRCRMIFT